jgi:hypothetical protein
MSDAKIYPFNFLMQNKLKLQLPWAFGSHVQSRADISALVPWRNFFSVIPGVNDKERKWVVTRVSSRCIEQMAQSKLSTTKSNFTPI